MYFHLIFPKGLYCLHCFDETFQRIDVVMEELDAMPLGENTR